MSQETRNLLDPEEALRAFVLVAHPDDETLWAGGLILSHPQWKVSIGSLCRGSDQERAPKFKEVCSRLGAVGSRIADLDDAPEQAKLSQQAVATAILDVVPPDGFDLLITHSLVGEYTRHRRHEETGAAVARLWTAGRISAREVWMFAYGDSGASKPPEAIGEADFAIRLNGAVFLAKYRLITEVYGFDNESWEAKTTPRVEAFWRFTQPGEIARKFKSGVPTRRPGG